MSNFLFPSNWRQTDDIAKPAIETPLGTVRLKTEIQGSILTADQATIYTSVKDARLFGWSSPAARAELMLCKVPYELDVTECRAAIWRIRAERQTLTNYVLTCGIELAGEYDGGPNSGEYLDAQTWSDGITSLSIGTLDSDAIDSFRRKGEMIPDRWAKSELRSITDYVSSGFVLKPPALQPGEIALFQFIVAWAPEPEGDFETWCAVYQSPAYILSVVTEPEG